MRRPDADTAGEGRGGDPVATLMRLAFLRTRKEKHGGKAADEADDCCYNNEPEIMIVTNTCNH